VRQVHLPSGSSTLPPRSPPLNTNLGFAFAFVRSRAPELRSVDRSVASLPNCPTPAREPVRALCHDPRVRSPSQLVLDAERGHLKSHRDLTMRVTG
jgi:hypothetical protein